LHALQASRLRLSDRALSENKRASPLSSGRAFTSALTVALILTGDLWEPSLVLSSAHRRCRHHQQKRRKTKQIRKRKTSYP
jgi:hypothetical protein